MGERGVGPVELTTKKAVRGGGGGLGVGADLEIVGPARSRPSLKQPPLRTSPDPI